MKLFPTAPILPVLGLLSACGSGQVGETSSSSTSITIVKPEKGWAETIEYRAEGPHPVLVLDGVRFELRDPAAYLLDWEAVGMRGITVVSSFTYESTVPVEDALLSVLGEGVEIRDGTLYWGGDEVGPVTEGDVVRVDADGVAIE